MQAIRTFSGLEISRRVLAIVAALIAAFVLGAAGGYVARDATVPSSHAGGASAAQGSLTAANGFDYIARPKRSGLQLGDDTLTTSPAVPSGADSCLWMNHHKAC